MQALMAMGKGTQKSAPKPQINMSALKKMTPQLTKEDYAQLVSQARVQGISEKDIEDGLNFLLQLN